MFDPRTDRDPVCDCSAPALPLDTLCLDCRIRYYADNDEPTAAHELGATYGLTTAQVDGVLRESLDYRAWAREQNAIKRCKRCLVPFTVHNRGAWAASGACVDCERLAMAAYVARVA